MDRIAAITPEDVYAALEQVYDPEIPMLSIVDLGIVRGIEVSPERVRVSITPTFVGCPALEMIRTTICEKLKERGVQEVEVHVDYSVPWSTNRITDRGRAILAERGFAPPPRFEGEFEPEILLTAQCPHCGSTNTTLRTPFGPALCRAIYFCHDCRQAFEQFKPL